jgi:hypothetical protein
MALTGYGERDLQAGAPLARGNQTMFAQAVVVVDGTGAELPAGGTAVAASSGNVANASAAATLAAVAAKTNFITGLEITFSGATAASVVLATVTGLLGGTQTFVVAVPAGAAVGGVPLAIRFSPPHPASAANVAITATLPALGAGNTNACVNVRGIQK